MWLLDTVALSEGRKPRPNLGFAAWAAKTRLLDIHTSVLCLGEIKRGVEALSDSPRRVALESWLIADLPARLQGRVLPVDEAVAAAWGGLGARGKAEPIDALIGCTAAVHGLTVVTRNSRHFDGLGAPVLNPWT